MLTRSAQVAIRDMRHDMGVPAGGRSWSVDERDTLMEEAMASLAEAGFFPPGSMDVPLLAEMIVFGDGGCILDKVRWSTMMLDCCRMLLQCEMTPRASVCHPRQQVVGARIECGLTEKGAASNLGVPTTAIAS